MLWLYQRTMFGKLDNPKNEKLLDMNAREMATLIPLVIMAFWIGIYPAPFFRALDAPVNKIVEAVRPGFFDAERVDDQELAVAPVQPLPAGDPDTAATGAIALDGALD